MEDVTHILRRIQAGDASAAAELLPAVYRELHQLAQRQMRSERPDHTLQATALVHEAYLRLVGDDPAAQRWESRGHFFAAAAEAMRRILVESARRRQALKRGGGGRRVPWDEVEVAAPQSQPDLLEIDDALTRLEATDPEAAQLVKLRYFSGLTLRQAAEVMQLPSRTADRLWAYAKAWLYREIGSD